MTREDIAERYSDEADNILFLDEPWYDGALLGVIEIDDIHVAVYSSEKCVNLIVENMKLSYEEAYEHFYYNVQSAYMGVYSPRFVDDEF